MFFCRIFLVSFVIRKEKGICTGMKFDSYSTYAPQTSFMIMHKSVSLALRIYIYIYNMCVCINIILSILYSYDFTYFLILRLWPIDP